MSDGLVGLCRGYLFLRLDEQPLSGSGSGCMAKHSRRMP
jgi:hypothetical protein